MKIGPKGVIGSVIAILIGLIAWTLKVDAGLSFVIGLIAEVIALQIDFYDRVMKDNEEIIVSLNLSRRIQKNSKFFPLLDSMLHYLNGIVETNYEFFTKIAYGYMIELSDKLRSIFGGELKIVKFQDVQLEGIWLLNNIRKSLFATSVITKDNYWVSDEGSEYHKRNMEAVRRGCKITRVFILDSPTFLRDSNFQKTLIEQENAGVDVRYVLSSFLPEGATRDFGIWDEIMVCYLNGIAEYYTSNARLQEAFKLRDLILNYSKVFAVGKEGQVDFSEVSLPENLLLVSAPLQKEYAQKYCYGGYLDESSCRWYHESWQYLRLVDMVVTPRLNGSFFIDYISKIVETSNELNILICGLADFEMLAVVLDAIGPVGQKNHKITVLDVCATPLKIAEWYAHERKTNIITRQADAKQTGFHAETFDLIVTDYFLTKLPLEDQAIVVSEWHRILKPEGRILTTIHLSSNHHGIQADESHIHQFSDKVERVALANSKSLRLDSKKMREYAEKYMRKNISYPIRDESELHHVFNGFELSIVSTFTSSVETIDSKTAQVVALKIG